jgi:branched-chain amino acid transport system substrate-binding protein
MVGVTNLAALGYSISPSSSLTAKSTAASAEHYGIKVGYLNPQFPFGGTNTGPAVLAMKQAGVNGSKGPSRPRPCSPSLTTSATPASR